MPAAVPSAQPDRPAGWLALTATQRGASHIAANQPNQDAVATWPIGPDGLVAAVADGHGHHRHVRSGRGSRLAVGVGCQVGQELADQLQDQNAFPAQRVVQPGEPTTASQITELTRDFLVPAILQRWREAVLADVAADPFTDVEQDMRPNGDDPTIAYGSTLLLAVTVRQWLILAQIGDGDVIGVGSDASAVLPVPGDSQLDGHYTTSLCGPDASSDFRIAVLDTSQTPLLAVLLASDGYGNAQVADQWADAFSRDLAEMLRERDLQWLTSQLPAWAARCASADGSADDTTVALLLTPPELARTPTVVVARPGAARPGAASPAPGSEETTVPAQIPPGLAGR